MLDFQELNKAEGENSPLVFFFNATLFLVVLGFLPFLFNYRETKFLLSEWTLLIFIAIFLLKNIWIKLFLSWCVIRHAIGFFEIGHISAEAQIKYFKLSYVTLNTIVIYLLAYHCMISRLTKSNIKLILNGICVLTLTQCVWMALQIIGVWVFIQPKAGLNVIEKYLDGWLIIADPINVKSKYADTFTGLMSNTNMASSVLAIGLPAFLRETWCLCIPLVVACIFMTRSLGGILPMFLLSIVWLLINYPKAWCFVLFSIGILLFYIFSSENISNVLTGSGRFPLWRECLLDPISKRFWHGWGLGQFKVAHLAINRLVYFGNSNFHQMHNEYLQLLFEGGFLGLSLFLGYIFDLFRRVLKIENKYKVVIMLGVLIGLFNASVNFLFHTTAAWLLLTYFGLAEILTKKQELDNGKIQVFRQEKKIYS